MVGKRLGGQNTSRTFTSTKMIIMTIKPKRGVTYECYVGYIDRFGNRVRRGKRYAVLSEGLRDDYYLISVSGRGYGIAVPKKEFASRFIPVNPID